MRRTKILLSSGRTVTVKGTPEEIEAKIAREQKTVHNYAYNEHNQTLAYSWVDPCFHVFEAADSRRAIRLRVDSIEALLDPQERIT